MIVIFVVKFLFTYTLFICFKNVVLSTSTSLTSSSTISSHTDSDVSKLTGASGTGVTSSTPVSNSQPSSVTVPMSPPTSSVIVPTTHNQLSQPSLSQASLVSANLNNEPDKETVSPQSFPVNEVVPVTHTTTQVIKVSVPVENNHSEHSSSLSSTETTKSNSSIPLPSGVSENELIVVNITHRKSTDQVEYELKDGYKHIFTAKNNFYIKQAVYDITSSNGKVHSQQVWTPSLEYAKGFILETPSGGDLTLTVLYKSDLDSLAIQESDASNFKLYTSDPSDNTKTVELDKSKYDVKQEGKVIYYKWDSNFKCTTINFENDTVWKYSSGKYPIGLQFHPEDGKVVVDFEDKTVTYSKKDKISKMQGVSVNTQEVDLSSNKKLNESSKLVSGLTEGMGHTVTSPDSPGQSSSISSCPNGNLRLLQESEYPTNFKLYTYKDSNVNITVEIDTDKYTVEQYENLKDQYFYKFKSDIKCIKVDCDGREVWKYDSTIFGENYPTQITFVIDKSINIYFKTSELTFKKDNNESWEFAFQKGFDSIEEKLKTNLKKNSLDSVSTKTHEQNKKIETDKEKEDESTKEKSTAEEIKTSKEEDEEGAYSTSTREEHESEKETTKSTENPSTKPTETDSTKITEEQKKETETVTVIKPVAIATPTDQTEDKTKITVTTKETTEVESTSIPEKKETETIFTPVKEHKEPVKEVEVCYLDHATFASGYSSSLITEAKLYDETELEKSKKTEMFSDDATFSSGYSSSLITQAKLYDEKISVPEKPEQKDSKKSDEDTSTVASESEESSTNEQTLSSVESTPTFTENEVESQTTSSTTVEQSGGPTPTEADSGSVTTPDDSSQSSPPPVESETTASKGTETSETSDNQNIILTEDSDDIEESESSGIKLYKADPNDETKKVELDDTDYESSRFFGDEEYIVDDNIKCILVRFDGKKIWKKGEHDINEITSVTYDETLKQIVVRNIKTGALFNKKSSGSWNFSYTVTY